MTSNDPDNRGLLEALIGDGRPLLIFTGLCLLLADGFALFLSATRHFLPHDVQFLGMTAEQLCGIQNCRVVYFMVHDRVSFGGALIIMTVGMTKVFVSQDLKFMGLGAVDVRSINPRLIPLIAHDRAGFGGAICTTGIIVLFSVWCAKASKGLWQVLCFAGTVGFATAIGVHPAVGYIDLVHLAPALLGAATFLAGIVLCYKPMVKGVGS